MITRERIKVLRNLDGDLNVSYLFTVIEETLDEVERVTRERNNLAAVYRGECGTEYIGDKIDTWVNEWKALHGRK